MATVVERVKAEAEARKKQTPNEGRDQAKQDERGDANAAPVAPADASDGAHGHDVSAGPADGRVPTLCPSCKKGTLVETTETGTFSGLPIIGRKCDSCPYVAAPRYARR